MQAKLLTVGGDTDHLLSKITDGINRASVIEISVAFIQKSGIDLLYDALHDALTRQAEIRILTSDYLGVTHPVALKQLMVFKERGADIRVYECDGSQSFHMKSYIFLKEQKNNYIEGKAYIGSSNISKAALTNGHEWNLCFECSGDTSDWHTKEFINIRNQFDRIFNHENVSLLNHDWISNYIEKRPNTIIFPVSKEENIEEVSPTEIQMEALQALEKSRLDGCTKGLVVLATGLGKTWLSAFDTINLKAKRILFVAHRKEILLQAQLTYIKIHSQLRTGFFQGSKKDFDADILFASVQTLGKKESLNKFNKEHFDYIIVDEFHHARAKTYKNIINHFSPEFMLGLTATPERTDQADILGLCDNNLVFDANLVVGINKELLSPFHYFGIEDQVNYKEIPWRNGRFDPEELTNKFATEKRAKHVLFNWEEKRQQRTLAFCISKRHADYMSKTFKAAGYKAEAVYSGSITQRHEALRALNNKELDVIFSVDLFNEGTDLPSIDTVLMLRPTESKILFLQQLGRGLRLHKEKEKLVVIDFIGNHKSFLIKPAALYNMHANTKLIREIKKQVFKLPKGCFINYEPKVIDILEKLVKAQPVSIRNEYRELKDQLGYRPTATQFYHYIMEANIGFHRVSKECDSWFELLRTEGDLTEAENEILDEFSDLLYTGVETTNMSKSFKMFLLSALVDLGGFESSVTIEQLSVTSYNLLSTRPKIKEKDLENKEKFMRNDFNPSSEAWVGYWMRNPINAYCSRESRWFNIADSNFVFTASDQIKNIDVFHNMILELIELKIEQYANRFR